MSDRVVRVDFEHRARDVIWASNAAHAVEHSYVRDRLLGLLPLVAGVWLLVVARQWWRVFFAVTGTLVVVGVPVGAVLAWPRLRDPEVRGSYSFRANERGFRYDTPRGEMVVPWSAVTQIVESRRMFVLRSGAQYLGYVPKRAFAPGDADRFRELALDRITVHRPGPAT